MDKGKEIKSQFINWQDMDISLKESMKLGIHEDRKCSKEEMEYIRSLIVKSLK